MSRLMKSTVLDRTSGPEGGPVKYLHGDIQDLGQVMEAMTGAEAVIHLAAIHNPNIATTTVTYQTNVDRHIQRSSRRFPSRRQARRLGQQQCHCRLELQ